MIRGLFLFIFSALNLLPASARENVTFFPASLISIPIANPLTVYSTEWETVPAWQLAEGSGSLLYTYNRALEPVSAAVLEEGVVVVFAKGYDFEGVSKAEEKPLGLPFYMALAGEAALTPYAWSYSAKEARVTVGLSMGAALKEGFEQARKDIQLRFFVLSPDFLRQHKLTPKAVRKMPYAQLVALLNTAP
jgi:hypothetical protein